MPGQEGAPIAPGQDPAAANQADNPTSPEHLAIAALERLETIYDIVVSGKTGVRSAFDRVTDPNRPQDDVRGTPALYADRIGIYTGPFASSPGSDEPVDRLDANRADTVPAPFGPNDHTLETADVTLDYGDRSALVNEMRPSAGRYGRVNLTRFTRLVTRDESGKPLYEDVAFLSQRVVHFIDEDPRQFMVRRNSLLKLGEGDGTDYSEDPHQDTEAFTRIVTEATDIVLEAAKARAEQPLAEAKAVVEACENLQTV